MRRRAFTRIEPLIAAAGIAPLAAADGVCTPVAYLPSAALRDPLGTPRPGDMPALVPRGADS